MKKDSEAIKNRETKFRCKECEGYGHYHAEYPNFLKRKNKSYSATLSNDDENVESSSDSDDEIRALMGCLSFKSSQVTFSSNILTDVVLVKTQECKSCHDELSFEEVH